MKKAKNRVKQPSDLSGRELVITRLLDAPRELVFKVWTEPEHVAQWWGPDGFINTIHEMDVKPGGIWRLTMHGPDGVDYPNKITFHKVVRPKLLVYSHGNENDPEQFEVSVNFVKKGQKTELTMRGVFSTKEELDLVVEKYGAREGQTQTINRLEAYLRVLSQSF